MAGAMRKMGVYLGLVEDDDRNEYDSYSDESYAEYDYTEDAPGYQPASGEDRARGVRRSVPVAAASTVAPAVASGVALRDRPSAVPRAASEYRITTLHPRTYNEARTIGEHFRDGVPVIMNLSEMDDSDAKRLVDFAAGLSFGLRGSIERVTNKVFLISPQNVSVTAEDKARLKQNGFFNQS
ncbi:MAG: cell division protein SepF [Geodermatophilaceae bacterium]|nr:cell division protein SepF [Geodermatophilaceae bacterium]